MIKILLVIIAILILLIVSMIFMLRSLIKSKKETETKLKKTEYELSDFTSKIHNYVKEQKENEEMLQDAMSGNNADSFNSSIELLHKLSEKGKERNKS